VAKKHHIPKKYIKPILEQLVRSPQEKSELFNDLRVLIQSVEALRSHIVSMQKRLEELREFAKDDEYERISKSISIYAYFGYVIVGFDSLARDFSEIIDNGQEFKFIADTFVKILEEQEGIKIGYTDEEILS